MTTFGEFLREERKKLGLNQSEFGHYLNIIMTDISKIENGHKIFPFDNLEALAKLIEREYLELKNLYVADRLVEEVRKYKCSDEVFSVAETQSRNMRYRKAKQSKIKFK